MQLWHLFKYAELTEVARRNDKLFVGLLNKIRVNNNDDDVEKLLKARISHKSDENYPKHSLHIYAENEPTMKKIDAVLNDLLGELYTIEAHDCNVQKLFVNFSVEQAGLKQT